MHVYIPSLVDARYNPVLHDLRISLPVLTVLPQALLLISQLTMNKQDGEVQNIEVREDHAVSPSRAL